MIKTFVQDNYFSEVKKILSATSTSMYIFICYCCSIKRSYFPFEVEKILSLGTQMFFKSKNQYLNFLSI